MERIDDYKNLNPADFAPFKYPAEVEFFKKAHNEDFMLLLKTWFPGEQGAHLEA